MVMDILTNIHDREKGMVTCLPEQKLDRWRRELERITEKNPMAWQRQADYCTTATMVALIFPTCDVFRIDQAHQTMIISLGVLKKYADKEKKGCRVFAVNVAFQQVLEKSSRQYYGYHKLYERAWQACKDTQFGRFGQDRITRQFRNAIISVGL